MNAALVKPPLMSAHEYFMWEADQSERHDFYHGEVFAMAGGSDEHNTASLNVASALKSHLRGTPCRVFMSDMRLELAVNSHYSYPDIFVTCDPRDATAQASHLKKYPKLVVEVLSPTTSEYDQGRKFEQYRKIASLDEVLFIDPERRSIELYQRTKQERQWLLTAAPEGGSVHLRSVDMDLSMATVFEAIDPAPSA
ncbi:MAG: Uma2 family endonuclease [Burkholderiaceae bacterium]